MMFADSISLAPALKPRPRCAGLGTPTGFAAETRMRTIIGLRAVADLRPGDLLLDTYGQIIALLGIRERNTSAANLVRIDPSAFGLGVRMGCVHRRLTVGAGQRLGVRDWRTDILFGGPGLTQASRLIDGLHVHHETADTALYQLEFAEDVILDANGFAAQVRRSDA